MLDLKPKDSTSIEGLSEYGVAFIDCLENYDIKYLNREEIIQVCKDIEIAHKDRDRFTKDPDTGIKEKYHTHLYEVAFRYLQYGGKYITHMGLVAALRHDDIEDLKEVTFEDIKKENGMLSALCVEVLTKPEIEKGQSKQERDNSYFPIFRSLGTLLDVIEQIAEQNGIDLGEEEKMFISRSVAVIKISDRIHNLLTMPEDFDEETRSRKIKQTEDYLIPLAHSLGLPELRDKLVKAIIRNERFKHKSKYGHALRRYR